MSATLEPREVEKPFWKRWLRMSWQLFVRSPVRFGILVALLGWVDSTAVKLSYGFVIPRIWVERLGMLLLPVLFAIVCAVARGADDARQTWRVLRGFIYMRFWGKALAGGLALALFEWVVYHALLLVPDPGAKPLYSHESGALLTSFISKTVLVNWVLGICYAPLIVFWPELSFAETRKLSHSAATVNDRSRFTYLVCGVMLVGLPLTLIPSYGMTEAALLVFVGILSYVAYRDIFERRDENLPAQVASGRSVHAPDGGGELGLDLLKRAGVLRTRVARFADQPQVPRGGLQVPRGAGAAQRGT
jgi:hypothetical protein